MGRELRQINARPTRRQTDKARAAIQTTKLVQRLHQVAMGECETNPSQIRAALGLLAKTLPDLTATEFKDVTPDMGTPEEAKTAFEELSRGHMLHQLMKTGMTQEQAESVLDGRVPVHVVEG